MLELSDGEIYEYVKRVLAELPPGEKGLGTTELSRRIVEEVKREGKSAPGAEQLRKKLIRLLPKCEDIEQRVSVVEVTNGEGKAYSRKATTWALIRKRHQRRGKPSKTKPAKEVISKVKVAQILDDCCQLLVDHKTLMETLPQRMKSVVDYQDLMDELDERKQQAEELRKLFDTNGSSPSTPASDVRDCQASSPREFRERASGTVQRILVRCDTIKSRAVKLAEEQEDIKEFVLQTCEFVDSNVRRAWGAGLHLDLLSYKWNLSDNLVTMELANDGDDRIDLSEVYFDGVRVTAIHASPGSVAPGAKTILEFHPDIGSSTRGKIHNAVIVSGFARFTYTISPT